MKDCIFCRIVQGQAPAQIVYQDQRVTAFQDLHPRAPVHILIVPNHHLDGVDQVTPVDEPALGRLFTVARHLAEELELEGYRLVVNTGLQAGQSIYHLHMHLMGGRSFGWPPG
ncbi:MAG: histidine triad nucleotide-binding protein [Anaerolineae bacterium]|nr:histidine triad nucleotide-binding protein [Anaerolineae bacterium]